MRPAIEKKGFNDRDWIRNCPRRIMAGLHVPDYDQLPDTAKPAGKPALEGILANVNPAALARDIKKAHIQAFWIYSKCHYGNAYYPSKAGHVHSALKGRDLFGELVEACRAEDIAPLCVYEFADTRIPKTHPDWCHHIPEEKQFKQTGVGAADCAPVGGACLNGPYGDFAIEQMREVLQRYPIKAYYVDFLGLFGFEKWICPYCNPRLKRVLGRDFPGTANLDHDEFARYVEWRLADIDAYIRRLRAALKRLRPDVAFVHNFHGFWGAPDLQWFDTASRNCDFLTADIFQYREGLLQMSWKLRLLAAGSRPLPAESLLDSVTCMRGDYATPKAPDSYRAELWTARSVNVASCVSFIMNLDGSYDRPVFALIERVMREQADAEPWLRDMQTLGLVGIVRDSRSPAFRPDETDGCAVKTGNHRPELEGWCQVLVAAHQLWDVVDASRLTASNLRRFKALILPNMSCMSEAQAAAIKEFVRNGGVLIATGDTSLFDPDGNRLGDFRLAPALGVNWLADMDLENSRLIATDPALTAGFEPWISPVICFKDGQLSVRARAGAVVSGKIGRPLAGRAMTNKVLVSETPGLICHAYGKGRCWYFAGRPGMQFRYIGQNNLKRLMKAVLAESVGKAAPVRLEAPDTVELFAHHQPGKKHLVVNLVHSVWGVSRSAGNWSFIDGSRGGYRFDDIETMPRLHEVRLFFRNERARKIRSVYLAPARKKLPMKTVGNEVAVTLKNVGVHTMVVAEWA